MRHTVILVCDEEVKNAHKAFYPDSSLDKLRAVKCPGELWEVFYNTEFFKGKAIFEADYVLHVICNILKLGGLIQLIQN